MADRNRMFPDRVLGPVSQMNSMMITQTRELKGRGTGKIDVYDSRVAKLGELSVEVRSVRIKTQLSRPTGETTMFALRHNNSSRFFLGRAKRNCNNVLGNPRYHAISSTNFQHLPIPPEHEAATFLRYLRHPTGSSVRPKTHYPV